MNISKLFQVLKKRQKILYNISKDAKDEQLQDENSN